ncbi:MAG: HupE/UreJ family protein [Pseudomonadota bacterium]
MTTKTRAAAFAATLVPMILFALPAAAHPGHGEGSGLAAGLLHPVTGLDHVAAMLAIGLWAAMIGGRAALAMGVTLTLGMIAGASLLAVGIGLPFVESGILLSLLAAGLALSLAFRPSAIFAALLVGGFALFHGYAHAVAAPVGASWLAYIGGFVVSSIALCAVGAVLGRLLVKPIGFRLAGAATMSVGLVFALV